MQAIIDDHYNALNNKEEAGGTSEPAGETAPSRGSILPKRPGGSRIPRSDANTQGTFTSFPPSPPSRLEVRDPPIGRPTPPSDQSYRAIAERALVENGATQTDEIAIDESDLIEIDTMNEVGERAEQSAERAERESSQELIRMAERLDGVDPRFVRAAHALETDKRTKGVQKDSHGQSEDVEDIDPKLLRAAAKAKDGATADGSGNTADDLLFDEDIDPDVEEKDEDDWRERLEQSNSNDIISFLPLPIAEDPDDILEE